MGVAIVNFVKNTVDLEIFNEQSFCMICQWSNWLNKLNNELYGHQLPLEV